MRPLDVAPTIGKRTTMTPMKRAKPQGPKPQTAKPDLAQNLRAEVPLVAGALTTLIFFTIGKDWTEDFSQPWLTVLLLLWLFAAMIWCAFSVVRHADILAEYLGEPYGTLVLTIEVVAIEVTIMATVMLHGGPNPTLPRDTVFAVLMIVLNGMVGVSIVVGALRHQQQQYNLQGAIAFLAVITCLAVISLVLPSATRTTGNGSMTPLEAGVFGGLTAALYAGFLMIQTMRHRAFFVETAAATKRRAPAGAVQAPGHQSVHGQKNSLPYHATLLILTLLPVVLLSKPLAHVIDYGIEQLEAPAPLGGVLIAILVLAPEGVTSYQAARRNQLQRSVNLSLGSALSTIGLTIPTMLAISLMLGAPLELGLSSADIVLLVLTLFVAQMTFSGAPTNILLGGVHLVLFVAFLVLVFNP
jgi:Ca2+:H+ antiporter